MLLVFYQYLAYAQEPCNIALNIKLVEKHNGQVVSPAVVHVDEVNLTVEADEKGIVTIDKLCAGIYTFHVHAAGHEHYLEKVNVSKNGELKFRLAHLEGWLDEVEISEERTSTVIQDKDKLDKEALTQQAGNNLGDVLKTVNGLNTLNTGATISKPVIHGLHSNRLILLNNGIRQEDQQWGSEHAPNIDPFLANNITVIKGAAGVKYGTEAIAGVVLIEPAPLRRKPGWDAELNLAAFSNNRMGVASATVEHNFKKLPPLSFRLQGTYKKGGNYRTPNYWVANTGVEENNYSATVGWNKLHYGVEVFYSHFDTDLGIYRGSHTGNQQDLNAAIHSDTPLVSAGFTYDLERPRQHVVHDLFKAKMYKDSRVGMWHATYAYQHNFRQEYDITRTPTDDAQMNLTLNTQTLNLNLEHVPVWGLTGELGVDGIFQENFIQPGDRLFIPNFRSRGIGSYLIERYKGADWVVEGGLRFDYRWYELFNPEGRNGEVVRYELDYKNLSATIGFTKNLSDDWQYSVILSNAWRAPQSNELFSAGLHHGAARIEYGNKDLKAERAYSINTEVKGAIGEKLTTDISLYAQYIQDFIYLQPQAYQLTIRGFFKTFGYTQTNASLSGTDITLNYNWTDNFSTDLKSSFLFARDLKAEDWLILMPADRMTLGNRYQTNVGNKLKDAFIQVQGQYVFSQWRIPENFDEIDYPRPPDAYFLLNATIGATVNAGKQPFQISLTGNNLLNTRYRDYLDAFRYFVDQPGRNIILRLRMPLTFEQ